MVNLNLYIDPGTGSMLFTVLIGVLSAAVYGARTLFIKLRTGAGRKADKNKIPLVIYSDNKRYWNTFEPICDELEKRGQDAVFMTASPDDPALKKELYVPSGSICFLEINCMFAIFSLLLSARRCKPCRSYCIRISRACSNTRAPSPYSPGIPAAISSPVEAGFLRWPYGL